MIHTLVQSAFQTGCLSVESEGLIRQVLAIRGYKAADLEVLEKLYDAVHAGVIQREAPGEIEMLLERRGSIAKQR
ncbi:MAG TPA: hypothetical protein V6C63_05260 [Allocoleopsis sp.]